MIFRLLLAIVLSVANAGPYFSKAANVPPPHITSDENIKYLYCLWQRAEAEKNMNSACSIVSSIPQLEADSGSPCQKNTTEFKNWESRTTRLEAGLRKKYSSTMFEFTDDGDARPNRSLAFH